MEQQELANIRKHIGKSAKRLEREDEDMPTKGPRAMGIRQTRECMLIPMVLRCRPRNPG